MLITKIEEIRKKVLQWKLDGLKIGYVPTMGALHEGHLSLIKKSVETCDKTVVTVFVNPTQFGVNEDFDKYPRTLENDLKLCEKEKVDIVFSPNIKEMYEEKDNSNNNFTYVCPPFFYVDKLCGKQRVGHFDGVCTVVSKFFNIIQPDYAFFGQKDAQQLIIIKKMVKDLNFPIKIVACPIVREKSGLALSSRNKYLTEKQKEDALALNKILFNIKACYEKGLNDVETLKETAYSFLNSNAHELDYLEFVDKNSLEFKKIADNETLVLIAVKVGKVRLIDNIELS